MSEHRHNVPLRLDLRINGLKLMDDDILETVFEDGEIVQQYHWESICARAQSRPLL